MDEITVSQPEVRDLNSLSWNNAINFEVRSKIFKPQDFKQLTKVHLFNTTNWNHFMDDPSDLSITYDNLDKIEFVGPWTIEISHDWWADRINYGTLPKHFNATNIWVNARTAYYPWGWTYSFYLTDCTLQYMWSYWSYPPSIWKVDGNNTAILKNTKMEMITINSWHTFNLSLFKWSSIWSWLASIVNNGTLYLIMDWESTFDYFLQVWSGTVTTNLKDKLWNIWFNYRNWVQMVTNMAIWDYYVELDPTSNYVWYYLFDHGTNRQLVIRCKNLTNACTIYPHSWWTIGWLSSFVFTHVWQTVWLEKITWDNDRRIINVAYIGWWLPQVQSDRAETNSTLPSFIKNKNVTFWQLDSNKTLIFNSSWTLYSQNGTNNERYIQIIASGSWGVTYTLPNWSHSWKQIQIKTVIKNWPVTLVPDWTFATNIEWVSSFVFTESNECITLQYNSWDSFWQIIDHYKPSLMTPVQNSSDINFLDEYLGRIDPHRQVFAWININNMILINYPIVNWKLKVTLSNTNIKDNYDYIMTATDNHTLSIDIYAIRRSFLPQWPNTSQIFHIEWFSGITDWDYIVTSASTSLTIVIDYPPATLTPWQIRDETSW